MSWDIILLGDDGTLETRERHAEGGTYALGGTTACDLNVTYNYSTLLAKYDVHPTRDLDGKTARETMDALLVARYRLVADAIEADNHGVVEGAQLGCDNYWHDCAANAARTVSTLYGWSREHPEGTWSVT